MQLKLMFSLLLLLSSCNLSHVDKGVSEGQGVVRRVDIGHKMITIDHGDIPNLVHAMTMAYRVNNVGLLHQVTAGDTAMFTLNETAPGDFTLMSIRKKNGLVDTLPKPPVVKRKVRRL